PPVRVGPGDRLGDGAAVGRGHSRGRTLFLDTNGARFSAAAARCGCRAWAPSSPRILLAASVDSLRKKTGTAALPRMLALGSGFPRNPPALGRHPCDGSSAGRARGRERQGSSPDENNFT